MSPDFYTVLFWIDGRIERIDGITWEVLKYIYPKIESPYGVFKDIETDERNTLLLLRKEK